jgi:hypothetical protein
MKNTSGKNISWWVIGLAVMLLCAACASTGDKPDQLSSAPRAPEPAIPEPTAQEALPPPVVAPSRPSPEVVAYFVHTVRFKGESVSIIARWYTGDSKNWKILAEHNPDINPNRMFMGSKIRIPEYMMKTKAPMPKEFVDGFHAKPSKKEPARPAASPDKEDEPKLFGPKE